MEIKDEAVEEIKQNLEKYLENQCANFREAKREELSGMLSIKSLCIYNAWEIINRGENYGK